MVQYQSRRGNVMLNLTGGKIIPEYNKKLLTSTADYKRPPAG